MTTESLLLLFVLITGFIALYVLLKQQLEKSQQTQNLDDVVNKVFGMSSAKIAEQSKQILESEKQTIKVDLENKQKMIEKLVMDLQEDLGKRQQEIRLLEQDRSKKFGELVAQMNEHRQLTTELTVSTQQLAKVLSNNQTRGAWGERIIEDILTSNGLIEGVHYLRQTKQTAGSLRPDITLLLPNKRNVPIDVKFPYQEMQKLADAEGKVAREAHLKQFAIDLRQKIKKVSEYIDPSQDTLDYAILFVPNEMVFSFINQKMPDIVDEALRLRVMIVSPFTFLIVARTVLESYRNFMIGDRLKEVVKYIDEFTTEWQKFREKFEKYGRSISTLQSDYEELSGTRFRQLEKKVDKVKQSHQGSIEVAQEVQLLEE